MSKFLIQARNIILEIQNKRILEDISFSVDESELITIIGPNGAGKSSLLKILLGLEERSTGDVIRAPYLKVGYVPQTMRIDPIFPMTVESFFLLYAKKKKDIHEIMQRISIAHLKDTQLHQLSGGERQRVLLARALMSQPNLLILDEPTQGVDIAGQQVLHELILEIQRETQCAVLLVSHDLHFVLAGSDRVICLNQHICCFGKPEEIQQNTAYQQLFGAFSLAPYHHLHDHHHERSS